MRSVQKKTGEAKSREKKIERNMVIVFGGGISGLTIAHELMERGYNVCVLEKDDNMGSTDPDLGGMARTQWCYIPLLRPPNASETEAYQKLFPVQAYDKPLRIEGNDKDPHFEFPGDAALWGEKDPKAEEKVHEIFRLSSEYLKKEGQFYYVTVEVSVSQLNNDVDEILRNNWMYTRIEWLQDIYNKMVSKLPEDEQPDLWPRFQILLSVSNYTNEAKWKIDQARLPGEHGFRFFPSFYRHIFDTMQRIPIGQTRWPNEFSATCYDNLLPINALGIGISRGCDRRSFIVDRRSIGSFKETREFFEDFLESLGHTHRDINLVGVALFKYLTSCKERREEEYEGISWYDYISLGRLSSQAQYDLESMPQVIAALHGGDSDARTQGSITMQLLLDQLVQNERIDSTLNGPTSEAWFSHWREYLYSRGVRFIRAKLNGFKTEIINQETKIIVPDLENSPSQRIKRIMDEITAKISLNNISFVLALPLQEMAHLTKSFIQVAKDAGFHERDYEDLIRVKDFYPEASYKDDLSYASPCGPLKHLSGVQYFFREEIRFPRAHILFLDAPWGLTCISQQQFWRSENWNRKAKEYPDMPEVPYWTILSVDIATFHEPGIHKDGAKDKTAWEATDEQIAHEVWHQIEDAFKNGFEGSDFWPKQGETLPWPDAYHIDRNISVDKTTGKRRDLSPFLVNRTGEYRSRPGKPGEYKPQVGNWFMAGTFMQTFTRVTSMEAANESARHAVNAILKATDFVGDLCPIWDPEDYELPDLEWFLDLDRALWEDGSPHLVDILELERLPDQLLPRDAAHFFRRKPKKQSEEEMDPKRRPSDPFEEDDLIGRGAKKK